MISRRAMISSLGTCAAGAFNPLSAVTNSQPAKRTWVVALESFCVADTGKMAGVEAYLGGALVPLLNEIQKCTGICLDAIVAPHTPQALLITAYSSFDEMLEVRRRIASDRRIRQSRADLESAHTLSEVRSQVLVGTQECLRFPDGADRVKTGVLELRSYHAPGWRDCPPPRVSSVFRRAGIHPILNAATVAGEHIPRFTYLIPFESLAERQEAWSRLETDSEWLEMQRDSAARHGSVAKVVAKSIYRLAPYCQLA